MECTERVPPERVPPDNRRLCLFDRGRCGTPCGNGSRYCIKHLSATPKAAPTSHQCQHMVKGQQCKNRISATETRVLCATHAAKVSRKRRRTDAPVHKDMINKNPPLALHVFRIMTQERHRMKFKPNIYKRPLEHLKWVMKREKLLKKPVYPSGMEDDCEHYDSPHQYITLDEPPTTDQSAGDLTARALYLATLEQGLQKRVDSLMSEVNSYRRLQSECRSATIATIEAARSSVTKTTTLIEGHDLLPGSCPCELPNPATKYTCSVCPNKALPFTKFCPNHITRDSKQQLFVTCSVGVADGVCGAPTVISNPCNLHSLLKRYGVTQSMDMLTESSSSESEGEDGSHPAPNITLPSSPRPIAMMPHYPHSTPESPSEDSLSMPGMPLDMLPMQPDTILETSDMPEEPDIPITVRCLEASSGPPPNKRPRTKEEEIQQARALANMVKYQGYYYPGYTPGYVPGNSTPDSVYLQGYKDGEPIYGYYDRRRLEYEKFLARQHVAAVKEGASRPATPTNQSAVYTPHDPSQPISKDAKITPQGYYPQGYMQPLQRTPSPNIIRTTEPDLVPNKEVNKDQPLSPKLHNTRNNISKSVQSNGAAPNKVIEKGPNNEVPNREVQNREAHQLTPQQVAGPQKIPQMMPYNVQISAQMNPSFAHANASTNTQANATTQASATTIAALKSKISDGARKDEIVVKQEVHDKIVKPPTKDSKPPPSRNSKAHPPPGSKNNQPNTGNMTSLHQSQPTPQVHPHNQYYFQMAQMVPGNFPGYHVSQHPVHVAATQHPAHLTPVPPQNNGTSPSKDNKVSSNKATPKSSKEGTPTTPGSPAQTPQQLDEYQKFALQQRQRQIFFAQNQMAQSQIAQQQMAYRQQYQYYQQPQGPSKPADKKKKKPLPPATPPVKEKIKEDPPVKKGLTSSRTKKLPIPIITKDSQLSSLQSLMNTASSGRLPQLQDKMSDDMTNSVSTSMQTDILQRRNVPPNNKSSHKATKKSAKEDEVDLMKAKGKESFSKTASTPHPTTNQQYPLHYQMQGFGPANQATLAPVYAMPMNGYYVNGASPLYYQFRMDEESRGGERPMVIDDAVLSRNRPSSVLMKDPQWVKMFISGKEGDESQPPQPKVAPPPPKPKSASPREKKSPQKTPHRTLVFHNTEIGPYSDKLVKQQSDKLAKQQHKRGDHRTQGHRTTCSKPTSLHATNQLILQNDVLKCSGPTELAHYQSNNRYQEEGRTNHSMDIKSHDPSPPKRGEDGRSKQPSGNKKCSPNCQQNIATSQINSANQIAVYTSHDISPPITAQNTASQISCSQSQIRPIRSDCKKPIDMSQTDGVT